MTQAEILAAYGEIGVQLLKQKVAPYSATGKTVDSIRFESDDNRLLIIGRGYFKTLETGRGPRKGTQQGDFLENMLEYMKAKGIGSGLSDKKKRQLARFLTLKINREGDRMHKKGGRIVYSDVLDKFKDDLKNALKQQFVREFREKIAA